MKRVMLVCCRCGREFEPEDLKAIKESRGEFWGMPAYETMYYSPCCTDDFYEKEDEEYDEYDEEEG